MAGSNSFNEDHLSAGSEIESILKIAVQIAVQLPDLRSDSFMEVHQAFFNFMSDMIRKLYLGLC
jgi:hypothetical protein